MNNPDVHIKEFLSQTGWNNANRQRIAGDASARTYDRLTASNGETCILMDAPLEKGEDVRPFITIADHLRLHGLRTPEIYHQDINNGFLLIEDFGDQLFAKLMTKNPSQVTDLYRGAMDVLINLRNVPPLDLPYADSNWLVDMIDPLFEWYAPEVTPDQKADFLTIFRPFAEQVSQTKKIIMLRDYHVENLLLLSQEFGISSIGILDFQDAMLAHPAYDLVSILQDARRDVSEGSQTEAMAYYLAQTNTAKEPFQTDYAILGLQRNLRILGIFARLCQRDKKTHYVELIPRVWDHVMRNLQHPTLAPLKKSLLHILPEPSPAFLEHMKSRCLHPHSRP
ncbi:MAG: phosphotransferase [Sulfitobacter sp.]